MRFAGAALTALVAVAANPAWGDGSNDPSAAAAVADEIAHKQKMLSLFPDSAGSTQATPSVIPQLETDVDPSGTIATFQPNGPTQTATNAFFQDLGSNGRTCFTCHQPQDGWTVSAQHAQARFDADPNDPLFRLVDELTTTASV